MPDEIYEILLDFKENAGGYAKELESASNAFGNILNNTSFVTANTGGTVSPIQFAGMFSSIKGARAVKQAALAGRQLQNLERSFQRNVYKEISSRVPQVKAPRVTTQSSNNRSVRVASNIKTAQPVKRNTYQEKLEQEIERLEQEIERLDDINFNQNRRLEASEVPFNFNLRQSELKVDLTIERITNPLDNIIDKYRKIGDTTMEINYLEKLGN